MTIIGNKLHEASLGCLFAFIVIVCVPLAVYAQRTRIDLAFKNERMTAHLENASLRSVTQEIEEKKGIWFKLWFGDDDSLFNETVTMQFTNLPIHEGLERILSRVNYSFIFDESRLAGVMLFGRKEMIRHPPGSLRRR